MAFGIKQIETIPIEKEKYPDLIILGPVPDRGGYQLEQYIGDGGVVEVPRGVTCINAFAFEATEVTEVFLPEGVTEIKQMAFYGCRKLKRIHLPKGLQTIGTMDGEDGEGDQGAFADCVSLERIEFPEDMLYIGRRAFRGCTSLKEIQFGRGLDAICECAFMGCTGLETLILAGKACPLIRMRAFEGCTSLKRVYLGGTDPGPMAFQGCTSLEEVTIAGDAKRASFRGCTSLKTVKFLPPPNFDPNDPNPPGYTIWYNAFERCTSLERLVLPSYIAVVHFTAFRRCTSLKEVIFEGGPLSLCGGVFQGCTALEHVTLPDRTRTITGGVFQGCTALKQVEVPSGCSIDCDDSFGKAPSFPETCEILPKGGVHVGELTVEDGVLTRYVGEDGTIVLPRDVVRIGKGAFAHSGIISVVMHNRVWEIGEGAFEGCEKLTNINLQKSMQKIGARAFRGCTALNDVVFHSAVREIGEEAFAGCTSLYSVDIREGVTELGAAAFAGCTFIHYADIRGDITKLDRTFAGCTSLKYVDLPDTLTEVTSGTFENCTSVRHLDFGDGVATLDASAVAGCTSLAELRVGAHCEITNEEKLPEGCKVTRRGFWI